MRAIDLLLEAQLFEEAHDALNEQIESGTENYLFYLAYIQVHLGWTEEAMATIYEYQLNYPGSDQLSTLTGFQADIYHREGRIYEAYNEIGYALKLEPGCPVLKSKASEIYTDLNDLQSALNTWVLMGLALYCKRNINNVLE